MDLKVRGILHLALLLLVVERWTLRSGEFFICFPLLLVDIFSFFFALTVTKKELHSFRIYVLYYIFHSVSTI